jgi:hypothetical protein
MAHLKPALVMFFTITLPKSVYELGASDLARKAYIDTPVLGLTCERCV